MRPGARRTEAGSAAAGAAGGKKAAADFLRGPSGGPNAGGSGPATSSASGGAGGKAAVDRVTGISPQFVFLQLYHLSVFGKAPADGEVPVPLPKIPAIETSIKNLDRIHA